MKTRCNSEDDARGEYPSYKGVLLACGALPVHFFLTGTFGNGRPTLLVQSLNIASRLLEMRFWGSERTTRLPRRSSTFARCSPARSANSVAICQRPSKAALTGACACCAAWGAFGADCQKETFDGNVAGDESSDNAGREDVAANDVLCCCAAPRTCRRTISSMCSLALDMYSLTNLRRSFPWPILELVVHDSNTE